MKTLVGIVMGFFSGLLIYVAIAMIFANAQGGLSPAFAGMTLLGGWALSAFVLIRGAKTVSKVFSRGFLVGAAEWLVMIPVGVIFSGKFLAENATQFETDAEMAGATIGAGLLSFLTGGFAIAMAVVCLIGFAVAYFMGREMQPEMALPTRTCPECAERIQEAARKCRHCGALIAQEPEPVLQP
jgi:hypothetical protein